MISMKFFFWSLERLGVFNRIFAELAAKGGKPDQLMIGAFPNAKALLADPGYDADWLRAALERRGITRCIPSKTNRKAPIPHNTALYRQRHKVENMVGKLKDRRRIHTRYDRCAHSFMSAICIAATVIQWLPQ
jgi:transposase